MTTFKRAASFLLLVFMIFLALIFLFSCKNASSSSPVQEQIILKKDRHTA